MDLFRRTIDESRTVVLRDDGMWWCLDDGETPKTWEFASKAEREMAAALSANCKMIERFRSSLRSIADLPGCECDGYHGYRCGLCRARAIARDSLDGTTPPESEALPAIASAAHRRDDLNELRRDYENLREDRKEERHDL